MDRAILRLATTLSLAQNVGDPSIVDLNYKGFIQLSPDEYYLQTTSIQGGTTMVNPTVNLVDCLGNQVMDVTSFVAVQPFIDTNGDDQFIYEISPLNIDYHSKELFLEFLDSAAFNNIWYSNGFTITNDRIRETSRIDYRCIGYSDNLGIDFAAAPYYNSIRVVGFFNDIEDESTVKQYTQFTGNEISIDPLITERNAYKLEYSNIWNYRRLNRLFTSDIIYIDGVRCTTKPFLKKGERLGMSNMFEADFVGAMDFDDTYTPGQQLGLLEVVTRRPVNGATLTPTQLYSTEQADIGIWRVFFNQPLASISADASFSYYKDGVLQAILDSSIMSVVGNNLEIFTGAIIDITPPEVGVWTYEMTGTVTAINATTFELENMDSWSNTIVVGDWSDNGDWNAGDWFI